ncbi:hypothetical protein HZH66_013565 [Vespula vulgaris]|uniref:Uncharacterized protein n=1 Tax=Vespula vulgaris TaxID=7454 RepID=A0A834J5W1_VESVU|nr:hypothetical protein HZH66_013565 [Vespula vulgaris]
MYMDEREPQPLFPVLHNPHIVRVYFANPAQPDIPHLPPPYHPPTLQFLRSRLGSNLVPLWLHTDSAISGGFGGGDDSTGSSTGGNSGNGGGDGHGDGGTGGTGALSELTEY